MKIPRLSGSFGGTGAGPAAAGSALARPPALAGMAHRAQVLPAKDVDFCVPISCKKGKSVLDSWEYCAVVKESAINHDLCTQLKASARATYGDTCKNAGGLTQTNAKCYKK